ncbi:MAG: Stp1/IreP family PP2C-type Ser/Thr phosphatase [Actinomycetota bacterium]|nr:Stp1/IreP family PP2C-type Ser/Thr phosphatase [Actinomycetota bacterium]
MTSLRAGAATDTGQVRANNQDAILVAEPLFAVADGMGGHAAGEIASQVAVESLEVDDVSSVEALARAVRQANRAVWERAAGEPELRGMGTTMCVVALVDDGQADERIIVANVGDSRVYQFHDGDITQITDDHSLVEDLVREGRLSHEEARTHPQRNILTRVLGNEPDVEVDTWEIIPQRGDRYLLCSDGLFNEVDDDRIAAVLRRLADPEDAAHELVDMANQHGGRDNVSVVVVDVVDDDDRAAAASAALATATPTVASASPATTSVAATPSSSWPATGAGPARTPNVPTGGDTKSKGKSRPRLVTWRSLLFMCSVLIVVGGAVAAVAWFARSTYHVGVDDEQVVIYRGRPGGLLWIQPTLAERTELTLADVPSARRDAVTAGKEEPSLAQARDYVTALEEQAEAERRLTTTTTSPSTTTTSTPATSTPGALLGGTGSR